MSKTILVACRIKQSVLLKALESADNIITSVKLLHCTLVTKSTLSPVFQRSKFYSNVTIRNCTITGSYFQLFCNMSFHSQTVPTYIRTLDIHVSHSELTRCYTDAIIKTLNYCVIEKLTADESLASHIIVAIISEYYKGTKLCNVSLGISLVVIKTQGIAKISIIALFANCLLNEQKICLSSTELPNHQITDYTMYLFNNNTILDESIKNCKWMIQDVPIDVYYVHELQSTKATLHLFQTLTKYFEDSVVKIFLYCITQSGIFSSKSNHWLFNMLLKLYPWIVTLRINNCSDQLLNHQFTKTLSGIDRCWEHIDFSYCSIDNFNMSNLQQCLISSQCKIASLNLSHNKLSSGAGKYLSKLILFCQIKKLMISYNEITVEQLSQTFEEIQCEQIMTEIPTNVEVFHQESHGWIFYQLCPIDSIRISSQPLINIAIMKSCFDIQLNNIKLCSLILNTIPVLLSIQKSQ